MHEVKDCCVCQSSQKKIDGLHGAKMEARVQVQPVKSIELQLQPGKTCKHEKSTEGPNISLVASQVRGRNPDWSRDLRIVCCGWLVFTTISCDGDSKNSH